MNTENNNAMNQFCRNCGAKIEMGSQFCPFCGQGQRRENAQVAANTEPMSAEPKIVFDGQASVSAAPTANQDYVAPSTPKPKKRARKAIVILSILMVVFAAASVALTVVAVNMYDDVYSDKYWKEQKEVKEEYEFYHTHAVVYNDKENDYYHHYGCPYFNDSSFYIFNSELAEARGIKPCPYCIGN